MTATVGLPVDKVDAGTEGTNLVKQNDMVKIGLIMGVISMILGYTVLYFLGNAHFF